MIPENVLESIREAADIVDVISQYVSLKKVGRNYQGLCPFHQEKTPSFVVSHEKQLFHCFGCGVGGNVFTFVMKYENLSFVEAARGLAERYGIHVPETSRSGDDMRRDALYDVNAVAQEFYHRLLEEGDDGQIAHTYLKDRGISRITWADYGVGYAPRRWDALVRHLKGKGVDIKDAEAVGLIIPKRGGWYDRFRHRIMFPIRDAQGRVIGFGGRTLEDRDSPKYLNSPESFLYRKGRSLYGMDVARQHIIKEGGKVCVVEGYFDLLSMVQKDVKNIVATLGTALTPEHVRLLRRFATDCYFLFDGDEAGKKATVNAVTMCMREDLFSTVVPLPKGLDPDAYCRKGLSVAELLTRAVPGVEYCMKVMTEGLDLKDPRGKRQAVEALVPLLLQIPDGVTRDVYFKRLADVTGVSEEVVRQTSHRMRQRRTARLQNDVIPGVRISPEKKLVQMMLNYPEVVTRVRDAGVIKEIQSQELKTIAQAIITLQESDHAMSLDRLSLQLKDETMQEIAATLAMTDEVISRDEGVVIADDCIRTIKVAGLRREKEKLNKRIEEAEARGDEALLHSLLMSSEGVNREMRELRNERTKSSKRGEM